MPTKIPHAAILCVSLLTAASLSCNHESDSDLQKTVARYGFDYDRARVRAHQTREGLRGFLLFGGLTDGAASEDYSSELGRLLERWGELEFVRVLESVPDSLRGQALGHLAYEEGWGENESVWSHFSSTHPVLAGLIDAQSKRGSPPLTPE